MKKILIGIALLVLAYPLTAWVTGYLIEARVDRALEDGEGPMAQLTLLHHERHGLITSEDDATYEFGPNLRFERHYRRGWYSSTDDETVYAQSALVRALQPAALGAVPPATSARPAFMIHTLIHHGPLCGGGCFALARTESRFDLAGPAGIRLKALFGGSAPLSVAGRLDFLGGGSASFSSPPLSGVALGAGAQLYWSGLEGTTHLGPESDWYDLHFSAPRLRVHGEKGADFDIEAITLDSHFKRALRNLYAGDVTFGIAHMSLSAPDAAAPVTLTDLRLGMRSDRQDRFMNVSYQWTSGAIVDPRWTVSNTHVDFTFKHLELESLARFTDAFREASQRQDPSVPPTARAVQLMSALRQPMQALLAADPEWDIDRISVANAQGQALISGVIRWPGLTSADFSAAAGAAALAKLDVRIVVTLDEAFIKTLPGGADILTKLQPMIDQGYLSQASGALHTEIRMLKGETTINGKPFNPGAFAPGALGAPAMPAPPLAPAPFGSPPIHRPGVT